MCDPITAITALSAGVQAGSVLIGAAGQNQQATDNKAAAVQAFSDASKGLTLRESQEQGAANDTIMATDRKAREADAMTRVSAGAAGVAGVSVDMLLSGIQSDASKANAMTRKNTTSTLNQLSMERKGQESNMIARINSVKPESPLTTGLKLIGVGANFGADFLNSRPKTGRKG